MSIYVTHSLVPQTYSQKRPSVRLCMHPQGWGVEVERVENYSEEATLRASVLAFREDNDSVESASLSAPSILQTLQGNKDKLVQLSFLPCMSHPACTFILSFWSCLFPSLFTARCATREDLTWSDTGVLKQKIIPQGEATVTDLLMVLSQVQYACPESHSLSEPIGSHFTISELKLSWLDHWL